MTIQVKAIEPIPLRILFIMLYLESITRQEGLNEGISI